MRWLRRSNVPDHVPDTLPEPPENVQLVLEDGTVLSLECQYVGIVSGCHYWEAIAPDWFVWTPGCKLLAAVIPGKTGLGIRPRREFLAGSLREAADDEHA